MSHPTTSARTASAQAPSPRPSKARRDSGETRSEQIRAALERDILSGRLPPGTKLEEEALAEHYGASRTPVREALKHIASEGLVNLRPRQGAFVAQLTVGNLVEMFEVMALLEADCAALASRRHTTRDRAVLAAAHDACQRATKRNAPLDFYKANREFHETIYHATHNTFLEAQTNALRNRLEVYRRETTFHPGLMNVSLVEHEKILRAIFAMDEGAAALHMRGHLDTLRNDAVAMVEAVGGRS
ncbi:MAG: GntR family transcriptional regulator [Casimicrobiaceae bacterium]